MLRRWTTCARCVLWLVDGQGPGLEAEGVDVRARGVGGAQVERCRVGKWATRVVRRPIVNIMGKKRKGGGDEAVLRAASNALFT